MNTYKTIVHGKCPLIADRWDYYSVEVVSKGFIKCEDIESACDSVRGEQITQECMTKTIRKAIREECTVTLKGRHGQNCRAITQSC